MNNNTLRDVLAAEEQARRRVEEARARAEEIKREGRRKARAIRESVDEEFRKARQRLEREVEEAIREECEGLLEAGRRQASDAERRYEERSGEAVAAALRRLVGYEAGSARNPSEGGA